MRKFINGYDLEKTFGLIISNGGNVLFQFPTIKPPQISNDFIDQDGLDQDLAVKFLEAREFDFACVCEAETIADFTDKYFKLFSLLRQGGTYTYFDEYLNLPPIDVFYKSQSELSQLSRTSSGGYGLSFKLKLLETSPSGNFPLIELVDDLGNVLVP